MENEKLADRKDGLSLAAKYDISQLQRYSLFCRLYVVLSSLAARRIVSLRSSCKSWISVSTNRFHSVPRCSENGFCTRVAYDNPSAVVFSLFHVREQCGVQ